MQCGLGLVDVPADPKYRRSTLGARGIFPTPLSVVVRLPAFFETEKLMPVDKALGPLAVLQASGCKDSTLSASIETHLLRA